MSIFIDDTVKEGSIFGGALLMSGSCIGAGMLALPVVTAPAGFVPSVFMFLIAWAFMTATALLLLEANLSLGYDLSLISIAQKTLGGFGKVLCWILFLFLFYSLSIAYIAASGSILEGILGIPALSGSIFFTVVFGLFLLLGVRPVDYLNRLLMAGLIIAYIGLVSLGVAHINPTYLQASYYRYGILALPVLIISFGFHNMIPSLAMYLKGDAWRLRWTVLIGSAIPLVIYLIWEVVLLGIIPTQGRFGLLEALDQGQVATTALQRAIGKSWINTFAQSFALFAIITSFLAQSLSLVDFLSDGLKMAKVGLRRLFLVLLTLVPPFIFAYFYPDIFIRALNLAGGFSAVILFGVMPVMMVWTLRYKRGGTTARMLPFGRTLLVIIFIFALGIFLLEAAQELGISLVPDFVEVAP